MSIAGKSTIFLELAKAYRTREIFENLDGYFNDLPGNAGFSVVAEPRIVVSGVPGGAQELLRRDFSRLSGVAFVFCDGDTLNLMLRSARDMDTAPKEVKRILARYQLLEVRFPAGDRVSDIGVLGRRLELAFAGAPGVKLSKDVTRGGKTGDAQYLATALSEIRRFMASYASRVSVRPVGGAALHSGDSLVLQGLAGRLPVPGQSKEDGFVVVKLDKVDNGAAGGLIVQGDASYVDNVSAFMLLPGNKVGRYVGAASIADERGALSLALDEGAKLLRQAQNVDPAAGVAGSLRSYGEILAEIENVRKLLGSVQKGLGTVASTETRDALDKIARQIEGVSGDLDQLAATTARIKLAEGKLDETLDRFQAFQYLIQAKVDKDGLDRGEGGLGQRLLTVNQGLAALGGNLRKKARGIDDFINRFNPLVQVLLGWGERARVMAGQLDYFGGALTNGQAGQVLDGLLGATDSALKQLDGFNSSGASRGLLQAGEQLASLGGIDLGGIIQQMEYVRDSLPKLLDEEIGRSIGTIDRYLGGQAAPGERIQILANAGADMYGITAAARRASGRNDVGITRLPAGSVEPDLRGEIFRMLSEVRTTIAAMVLIALFILQFILDQTLIVAMLRRSRAGRTRRRKGIAGLAYNPALLYAAGSGAFWLWGSFIATGARLPLTGVWGAAVFGGLLGLALGILAERINPINGDEVLAGESLGLSFTMIMREIVIPAGRPGLMQLLNRRRRIMGRPSSLKAARTRAAGFKRI
jgi:hypothetical protein